MALHQMDPVERELLAECRRIADAHGCAISVTTRDDEPEQPLPVGVWADLGAGGIDLVGTGHALTDALADAMATMRGWE